MVTWSRFHFHADIPIAALSAFFSETRALHAVPKSLAVRRSHAPLVRPIFSEVASSCHGLCQAMLLPSWYWFCFKLCRNPSSIALFSFSWPLVYVWSSPQLPRTACQFPQGFLRSKHLATQSRDMQFHSAASVMYGQVLSRSWRSTGFEKRCSLGEET